MKKTIALFSLLATVSHGMEDISEEKPLKVSSEQDLSSYAIDPVQELESIDNLSSLTTLNFQNRGIRYPEALELLRYLAEHKDQLTQLEEINLWGSKIRLTKRLIKNDALVTTLLTILNLRSLKVLDISSNLTQDHVLRYLIDEIGQRANPLDYPNFSFNKLKYQDRPERFSDTLDWRERRITDAVLTDDDHPRSIVSLGRTLQIQSHTLLRVISFRNNEIAYDGFVSLMIFISTHHTQFPDLQSIDLSRNKIRFLRKYFETASPFPSLVDVLAKPSLESLVLNTNPITYDEFLYLKTSTIKAAVGRGDIPHFNVTKMRYENTDICLTARGALTPKEDQKD